MGDGSYYEGTFVNGDICGHGFRLWATSKNQYEGEFANGELNGQGVMRYGDGRQYEGSWKDNKHEGEWTRHLLMDWKIGIC